MKNIYRFFFLLISVGLQYSLNAQVAFHIDPISTACGASQQVTIPVKVNQLANVATFQFTIKFDPAKFTYAGFTGLTPAFAPSSSNLVNFGIDTSITNLDSGWIAVSWVRFVGALTIPTDTTIFSIKLNYLGGGSGSVEFLDDGPLDFEVTDAQGNLLPFTHTGGSVSATDTQAPSLVCPASVSMMSNTPIQVSNIGTLSVTDNCGVTGSQFAISGATQGNGTGTNASGTSFFPGISTVIYSATDGTNTGSCNFTVEVISQNQNDTLTLIAAPGALNCGQTDYYVDILVNNFDSIGSLQYSVTWDESLLQYNNFSMPLPALMLGPANYNLLETSSGSFGLSWTTLNPNQPYLNLADGTRIIRLHFTLLQTGNINTPIQFTSMPVPIEAFNNANPPGFEVPVITVGATASATDTEIPSLVCPPSTTVATSQNQSTVAVTGLIATFGDNCDPNPTATYQLFSNGGPIGNVVAGANANGTYPVGTTTIVYTVRDQSGNSNICFADVTVTGPAPVEFYIDTVQVGCMNTGTVDISVRVRNFADVVGTQFALGWDETVLDFDQIVYIDPIIGSTPLNFGFFTSTSTGVLQYFDGLSSGWPNLPDGSILFTMRFNIPTGTYTEPVEFINLPGFPFEVSNQAGDPLFTVTSNGFVVSGDNIDPVFTFCPPSDTINTPALECTTNYTWPPIQVSDNCGAIASLDSNITSNVFTTGNHVVIYTATDIAGNTSVCSFNVFVVDAIFPQFIVPCPQNIVTNVTANTCSKVVTWTAPTAFDACDQMSVPVMSNFNSGATFAAGVTTVVYSATDQSGNTTSCSFTVTVNESIEPVVTCPSDITELVSSGACNAVANWLPATAADNCTANPMVTSDIASGALFNAGFTTVTYTATDASGNTATCSFVVTVMETVMPSIVCPPNMTAQVSNTMPAICGGEASWMPATATDNCDNNVTVSPSITSGSYFPIGANTVEYTATDDSGNTATCSFTVEIIDNVAPVFTDCPAAQMITLSNTDCNTIVTWNEPTAATIDEPCGLSSFFTVGNFDSPDTLGVGNYSITYLAFDNAGNFSQCVFNLQIRDTVPPVLGVCPNDSVIVSTGCQETFNFTLPTAIDNCDMNVSVSSAPASGAALPVGSTTVYKIIAQDNYQNQDTCFFTVSVTGSQSASLVCPPSDTVYACSYTAQWDQPIAAGFCSLPLALSVAPFDTGTVLPAGNYLVTYIGSDLSGASASCSFNIIVRDTVAPTLACPSNVVVDATGSIVSDPSSFLTSAVPGAACTDAVLTYAALAVIDNCGPLTSVQISGVATGQAFAVGVTDMTFVVADGSNLVDTCRFTVTVQSVATMVNLVATGNPACPGEPLVISAPIIPGATYTWDGPGNVTFPNESSITISTVNASTAGVYALTITNNGCTVLGNPLTMAVALAPQANDDLVSLQGGQSATIMVLDNDINASDVTTTLLQTPSGITNVGDGIFDFAGSNVTGTMQFQYEICSDACPMVCDIATVTIDVKVSPCIYEPNVITPNGDGLNDEWIIPCLEFDVHPNNSLVIYNQWGDLVFEAAPYKPFPKSGAWTGGLKGDNSKPLPDGTYYYIFRESPTAAPRTGFVDIFR
jgi:gliding motility-associated-like protein